MVLSEALRFEPPTPFSTMTELSKDAKIGKYKIRAGTDLLVNFAGLHRRTDIWQRPHEFLP